MESAHSSATSTFGSEAQPDGLTQGQLDILRRHAGRGPRYTSYPPANVWTEQTSDAHLREGLAELCARPAPPELSVYVHLPFCPSQCWFCACNVLITPRTDLQDPYLDGLHKELDLLRPHLPTAKTVQLHWGGGSPSYLTPAQMRRLMAMLRNTFALDADAEIALEVDPRITTEAHLDTLRDLGFNRLSMGVQDFDKGVQVAIHRKQSLELTADFVALARSKGFDSLNMDLIYGLPVQNERSFGETLDAVVGLGPDRVALYGYAHVPWLKPSQTRIDQAIIPDKDLRFALFHQALRRFGTAGYADIGLDHFAKPTDALTVARANGTLQRNFMGYTTRGGTELVGVGLSSIGLVGGRFVQNEKKLKSWRAMLDAGRLPVSHAHALSDDDKLRADVISRMMCQGKVDFAQVAMVHGVQWRVALAESLQKLEPARQDGLFFWQGETLYLTELGKLLVRAVAMQFDAYLGEGGRYSQI